MNFKKQLHEGLLTNNPVVGQLLGMCSTMAITTPLFTGLGMGLSVTLIRGTDYNVFGLVGDTTKIAEKDVLANPWVENVTRVSAPY